MFLPINVLFCSIDATVYVGGLDEKVSEPLLWELFLQAGPVVNTHMPKDRVTGQHQGKKHTFVIHIILVTPYNRGFFIETLPDIGRLAVMDFS